MISASLYTLLFNFGTFFLVLGTLFILWRLGERRTHLLAVLIGLVIFFLDLLLVPGYPGTQFGIIRLGAWICFVHFPTYLFGLAAVFRKRSPQSSTITLILAGIILLVGVDAFLVEPHWLDVGRLSIHSLKIDEPVRIVVIADIQTDHSGAYEYRVLQKALDQHPDLLLFAGDYIHLGWNSEAYRQEIDNLNAILSDFELHSPLGAFAIAGNVDSPAMWGGVFKGLPVEVIQDTTGYDLGAVYLSCLSFQDSIRTRISVRQMDQFHIVLGHSPNFSLGDIPADLLLAGHTHGGQVRLPFVGPIFTLSAVPRAWAAGVTEIAPGKILVVSRGVGLERMDAPRMRFLCRPEVVVIDLLPA